jgi:hypothetical protein
MKVDGDRSASFWKEFQRRSFFPGDAKWSPADRPASAS